MSNASSSSSSSSLTPPSIRLLASLIFTFPSLSPLFGQRPFFHSPSSTLERDPPFTLFPQQEGGRGESKQARPSPLRRGRGEGGGALFFRLGAADNCTFPDCLPATVISQRCARWRVAAIHPYKQQEERKVKARGEAMGPSCKLIFNYTTFAIVPCRKSWPSCPSWGTSARRSSCCRGPVAVVVVAAAAVAAAVVAAAAGQLRPGAAWDLRHRSRDPRSDICARKGESKLVFRR